MVNGIKYFNFLDCYVTFREEPPILNETTLSLFWMEVFNLECYIQGCRLRFEYDTFVTNDINYTSLW